MGLVTHRINDKLENSKLINEHTLNREPVPLKNIPSISCMKECSLHL